MTAGRLLPAVLLASVAFAQRLEFEVASVKPAAPGIPGQIPVGLHIDGAQVSFRFLSLQDYIVSAYDIKKHQIAGPDWLSTERYDIQAKVPAGISNEAMREKIREMMQTLLEDRFKLKYHKETRELPVYALVVNKGGLKIKDSGSDPEAEAKGKPVDVSVNAGRGGTTVTLPGGASITYAFLYLEAKKVTMAYLADNLARLVDRPVIDATDLKGAYDFKLDYSLEDMKTMMRTSGTDPNMLAGVPDQGTPVTTSLQTLGLKLESRKAPMEVYVIDRVEKTPTAN
jgi:uncharacterized protein (TIGR03435 family)